MKKIVTIIGARPQFIKAAALSRELKKHNNIKEIIIHTGQHYDNNMSDIFFEQMDIPRPQYNLNINGLNHGAMTGQMLEKIEEVLIKEHPEWVLVYGDTNSTLAGALAARKLHFKVAHVEAGLRSFNMSMPEEINRILTDRISNILFCPTENALENLNNEGYKNFNCRIIKNGDVMQDAALFYENKAQKPTFEIPEKFILATVHRAENTDDISRLTEIFEAFEELSKTISVVLPLHPRTKQKLTVLNYNLSESSIYFIEPVGYLEMVYLLRNCSVVMTDSGGLQKEAFFFKKPCITLRDETEWVELVDNGFNILTGSDKNKIYSTVIQLLDKQFSFDIDLYGNGKACERIIKEISAQ